MKQYLSCGIAKRIVIRSENEEESKDIILKRIGQNIDLNIYNKIYDDEYIILNMKKEIFEENVYELINEQIEKSLMNEFDKLYTQYKLKNLKDMKSGKKPDINVFHLKRGDEISNDISYLDSKGECKIYCDLVEILKAGETFFECYSGIFTYFRNCIIKASKNAIRTSMVITLAS